MNVDRTTLDRTLAIALPAIVLGWRIIASPATDLWRDWAALLALYALVRSYKSGSPRWPEVAVSSMAFLLALYVIGQLPHTLAAWGWGR